jgi:hypothetical protein
MQEGGEEKEGALDDKVNFLGIPKRVCRVGYEWIGKDEKGKYKGRNVMSGCL